MISGRIAADTLGARAFLLLAACLVLVLGPRPALAAATPFSDWAVGVVAGDFHAHSGGPTQAFDNARGDVASELARAGFSPARIRQFSTRPETYPNPLFKSEAETVAVQMHDLAATASGCLLYFTSHGGPQGMVLGSNVVSPAWMGGMVDYACGEKPTVVVISACYSGAFIPSLRRPNRMIMTAARRDRSSFGCSESDRYPFFDACVIKDLPSAADFPALARAVRRCVARKERATGMRPPSEPQLFEGAGLKPLLAQYRLHDVVPRRHDAHLRRTGARAKLSPRRRAP